MHANRILPFFLAFIVFLLIGVGASAQNAPNSLSPGNSKEVNPMLQTKTTTAKKKKHRTGVFSPKRQNVKHTARYEFYERIEQAAKEKQRILRKLAKPQYSDPRYFGHKRIPKRHQANKMRYCGQCGIRH
ncbi:MAG TPA: hypothetical protein VF473_05690 [Cyclobacteriaceae bacterium]